MEERLRGEAGANAVEFALVLPVLLAILLGLLWGGLALNSQLTLSQTAREGARYGATLPFPGAPNDWYDEVADRIEDSAAFQLTSGELSGCIRAYEAGSLVGTPRAIGPDGCTGPAISVSPEVAAQSRVEVQLSSPARFDYVLGGGTVTLSSDAVARHEGSE